MTTLRFRRNKDQSVVAETRKQSGAYSIVVPLEPSRNCPPMKIPVLNDVLPLYLGVFHSKLNVEGIFKLQVQSWNCCRALYTSKDHRSRFASYPPGIFELHWPSHLDITRIPFHSWWALKLMIIHFQFSKLGDDP